MFFVCCLGHRRSPMTSGLGPRNVIDQYRKAKLFLASFPDKFAGMLKHMQHWTWFSSSMAFVLVVFPFFRPNQGFDILARIFSFFAVVFSMFSCMANLFACSVFKFLAYVDLHVCYMFIVLCNVNIRRWYIKCPIDCLVLELDKLRNEHDSYVSVSPYIPILARAFPKFAGRISESRYVCS